MTARFSALESAIYTHIFFLKPRMLLDPLALLIDCADLGTGFIAKIKKEGNRQLVAGLRNNQCCW
jgi:hypothetical protein